MKIFIAKLKYVFSDQWMLDTMELDHMNNMMEQDEEHIRELEDYIQVLKVQLMCKGK